ncbi:hypothetical protein [Glycomyces paridis]|uniref:Uncharacterized protein n=1 Tax=Glycomyces paridis TaxID=2126555 RepID=A0A4S8PKI8_9ACTN|nr:hypothetical protein [Glycomyces paridis]THV28754.1 hypothetical protein E9998_11685 [Glycomyces paridis]
MNGLLDAKVPTGNVVHGDVRAGDGGTINMAAGDQIFLSIEALRRRIRFLSDPQRLDGEMASIVPPPDLDAHLRSLRETRLLILSGGPQTGLSTAARHRWKTFADASPGLDAEDFFPSGRDELLDELDRLRKPCVLLLDISHDREFGATLAESLPQVQAALREQDCRLVIALHEGASQEMRRAMPSAVHRLGRPDPVAVIARRTRRDDLVLRLLDNEEFANELATVWPPRAVPLAAFIEECPPDYDPNRLVEDLRPLLRDHSAELKKLVEDTVTTVGARALLIAAGALQGAGRDAIVFAAGDLTSVAGPEGHPTSPFEGPSLDQQFGALRPSIDPDSGRFLRPYDGDALLPYVWEQFPSWRTPIRAWLDLLLGSRRLDDDALSVLLPRLLSFAAATGAADLVTQRAAVIADRTRARRELAAGLLLAGSIDAAIGPQVRRQLRLWAYHDAVPSALLRSVALACGAPEYASRFPRSAFTRLRHLLSSKDESVRATAVEATVSAARSLPPQATLEYLGEWAGRDAETAERTAILLTAALADVEVRRRWVGDWLARDPHGAVVALWRSIFVNAGPGTVRDAVAAWLEFSAVAPPGHRAMLADRLSIAATVNFWTLGQLSQSVGEHAWAGRPASPGASVLRQRLADHLDQAKVAL